MAKRVLCCLTAMLVTVSAFAYRPPTARAVFSESEIAASMIYSALASAGIHFTVGSGGSSGLQSATTALVEEMIESIGGDNTALAGIDDAATYFSRITAGGTLVTTAAGKMALVLSSAASALIGTLGNWLSTAKGLSEADGEGAEVYGGGGFNLQTSGYYSGVYVFPDRSTAVGSEYYFNLPVITVTDGDLSVEDMLPYLVSVGGGESFSVVVVKRRGFYDCLYWLSGGEKVSNLSLRSNVSRWFGQIYYSSSYHNFHLLVYNTLPPNTIVMHDSALVSYPDGDVIGLEGFGFASVSEIGEIDSSSVSATQAATYAYPEVPSDRKLVVAVDVPEGAELTSVEDLPTYVVPAVLGGTLSATYEVQDTATDIPEDAGLLSWTKTIAQYVSDIKDRLLSIPESIAQAIAAALERLFALDEALAAEITGTFMGKFGWLEPLRDFWDDVTSLAPQPPVIYIHLENYTGAHNWRYGGREVALDLSWYAQYKPTVDLLLSGFLWLGFLWLLFKRASAIINGAEMVSEMTRDIDAGYVRGRERLRDRRP